MSSNHGRSRRWVLALVGGLAALAACGNGQTVNSMVSDGGAVNGDLAVPAGADLAGMVSAGADLAGADLAGAVSTNSDLSLVVTVNPPSGIWTSAGGGTFATAAGGQASFSIGGQSVYGTATSAGGTVTFGYFSSDTY